ncbi:hypothetical protein RvY_18569 [Ramazzottius varieornatus]|uniref:Protein wntless n=1 Tax=Ramazzottius varieornatus TaxID=947166 RepID=A0A1D1W7S3_RAMVA|nr:hypothetical protein RvY_18569 [Ramazzottius varieornatus]
MAAFIDTMSTKKLVAFGLLLLALQIVFFVIGGTIAPSPSNVASILSTKCIDNDKGKIDRWFYPRGSDKNKTCKVLHDLNSPDAERYSANNIVFAAQFPLPRDGFNLTMSRWFQYSLGVLHPEISYQDNGEEDFKTELEIHARIGYRNREDPEDAWKEIDRSVETRQLDCNIEEKHQDYLYNCSPMALYELGGVHHDFYLLNLRLPVTYSSDGTPIGKNVNLGKLLDLWIIEIHQNGGYTRVFWSVKTVFFPLVLAGVVWFWHRIQQLARPPKLMEKMLFTLGLGLLLLDTPIEWFSLGFNFPAMLLLSDIRQGLFYTILFAFWIIFAGEYQMDDVARGTLSTYWKHLSAVAACCISLFVFDMCERGVQLTNVFYSIWSTTTGSILAKGFLITAMCCACIYFFFLTYMVIIAVRNMWDKRKKLDKFQEKTRKRYQVIIFRFQFLLLMTLLCAAFTIIAFIIAQVGESSIKWGDEDRAGLEYTSAVNVGVFAMWNLYVTALLVLYSPSSKHESLINDEQSEDVAMSRLDLHATTTTSEVTEFLQKVAED